MLSENVGDLDVVGRLGGDEFAILLPETRIQPATLATCLQDLLNTPGRLTKMGAAAAALTHTDAAARIASACVAACEERIA